MARKLTLISQFLFANLLKRLTAHERRKFKDLLGKWEFQSTIFKDIQNFPFPYVTLIATNRYCRLAIEIYEEPVKFI